MTESLYANKMSSQLYDACRIIRDYFDRDDFENFIPDTDLIQRMQHAGSEYKIESISKASISKAKEFEASAMRCEVGVFKRKTTKEISSQLHHVDNELEEAEAKLEILKQRKIKLQDEQKAVVEHLEENSSNIINKWFKK